MKTLRLIILSFFILLSCKSWRSHLVVHGEKREAIRNVIRDYYHSKLIKPERKKYSVKVYDLGDSILGVSFFEQSEKLYPSKNVKIGKRNPHFPNEYIEYEKNLFFWHDSESTLSLNFVKKLSEYNCIDSINVKEQIILPEYLVDDSKKGVHYYICKGDYTKYEKEKTSIAFGYYPAPKVKCN